MGKRGFLRYFFAKIKLDKVYSLSSLGCVLQVEQRKRLPSVPSWGSCSLSCGKKSNRPGYSLLTLWIHKHFHPEINHIPSWCQLNIRAHGYDHNCKKIQSAHYDCVPNAKSHSCPRCDRQERRRGLKLSPDPTLMIFMRLRPFDWQICSPGNGSLRKCVNNDIIAASYRQIGALDAYANFKDVTQTPKQPPHSFIYPTIHSFICHSEAITRFPRTPVPSSALNKYIQRLHIFWGTRTINPTFLISS